ncbi:MAG: hypothetical protein H7A12_10280 [Pseudomonadales bacterium]|jgi:hypothetical protein|nr:hypothetical protein [Pseudomonadales bacterium]MCP5321197.1 hypothetical protein [Pseudomonadales bacterium]MCP5336111.1 hypothetical protein [Pseudomonadales bacterium]
MNHPAFFDQVRRIRVCDPLAELLGSCEGGFIEYGYVDAVRLAGHSCPTVAGAYLVTLRALARLFPTGPAERGGVRVHLRDGIGEGVTGVIANVVGMLTGAAGEGGFKGLAGRFERRDLLHFDAGIPASIRFERTRDGQAVDADFHPEHIAAPARMRELLGRVVSGTASASEQHEFGVLWQERVRRILIDGVDDDALVVLSGPH